MGKAGWKDIKDDNFNWRGAKVKSALKIFGGVPDQADPKADSMTWDRAVRKLGSGGCAFVSMNDSAYGELRSSGASPGTDFGTVAFPGTGGTFLAVTDVFVAAKKAKNPKNALAFLEGISGVPTQVKFSKAKGSVPVLKDVPVSSLSAYQRQASKTFWSAPVLMSLTNGELLDSQFQLGLFTAVRNFADSGDADGFLKDLEQAVARVPAR